MMESPAQHSNLPYRRDIDGLRAVAVMSVVIYHLDAHHLGGGFIGVDVFFVISGYLISSILFRDLEAGTFTFAKFYERRVRRIAPALIAVLAAVSLAALVFLFPPELTSYAKSLIAAVASASNFYFYAHTSYFDESASTHPLLHVWSLAVEEQFYILFPILLLLLRRFAWRWRKAIVATVFFLSFGLSWALLLTERTRTFYMLDTRAWELLTGSLIALSIFPALRSRWLRDGVSVIGLAAIFGAAAMYRMSTPFPGPAALVPCLGAALVIWSGRESESLAGRILAARPLVFLGTISYSLYLIHWPILVFVLMSRLCSVSPSAHGYYRLLRLGIVCVSIGAAYLSYRFIERPFRDRSVTRRTVFRATLAVSAAMVAFSICLIFTGGLPHRFPAEAVAASRYLEFDAKPAFREGPCFITPQTSYSEFRPDECLRIDPQRPNYLLLGDSHAAEYWHELTRVAPEINVLQATATGCKPFLKGSSHDYRDCRNLIDFIYGDFLEHHPVSAVILSARWGDDDLPDLRSTLVHLKSRGLRVILIGPSMEYAQALPRLIAVFIVEKRPEGVFREQVNEELELDPEMRALAADMGAEYVSPASIFCKTPHCDYITSSGVPVLFDQDHLTPEGAAEVLQTMKTDGRLR